MSMLTSS